MAKQPPLPGKYVNYGKEVLFEPEDKTKSRGEVCQAAREDVAEKIVKALNAAKDGLILSVADYAELKNLREWHRRLDTSAGPKEVVIPPLEDWPDELRLRFVSLLDMPLWTDEKRTILKLPPQDHTFKYSADNCPAHYPSTFNRGVCANCGGHTRVRNLRPD